MQLVTLVYRFTRSFPVEEKFDLAMQMQRCAVSIPSNIAEGNSRLSGKDKAYFTMMAYSSAMELASQMQLSFQLNYLSEADYREIYSRINHIATLLQRLRKAQLNLR